MRNPSLAGLVHFNAYATVAMMDSPGTGYVDDYD